MQDPVSMNSFAFSGRGFITRIESKAALSEMIGRLLFIRPLHLLRLFSFKCHRGVWSDWYPGTSVATPRTLTHIPPVHTRIINLLKALYRYGKRNTLIYPGTRTELEDLLIDLTELSL